jgi:protein phosphatase
MEPTVLGSPPTTVPKPRDEDLDFFGVTHPGKVRKENQDHYLFCTLHKTMRVGGTNLPNPELLELPSQRLASFGLVADGVGGRAGGAAASQAAVEALAGYVVHTMRMFYTADSANEAVFLESLRDAARLGHEAVVSRAEATGAGQAIATTLTAMIAIWPNLYLLHVGDSRCYRFRAGEVEQLTRDQTMAQDLVDSGVLPADRAKKSPFASVLSSSLGGATTQPVVTKSDLRLGDVILICTDGLTKHVSDQRITERIRGLTSSGQTCQELLDDALAGGGTDNITVLVLRARVRS